MSDDNVTRLPVLPKPDGKPMLRTVTSKCQHRQVEVDVTLLEVVCTDCGEKVSPIAVLCKFADTESRWFQAHARYVDEMKRLHERQRTKCDHCGKMTKISRR